MKSTRINSLLNVRKVPMSTYQLKGQHIGLKLGHKTKEHAIEEANDIGVDLPTRLHSSACNDPENFLSQTKMGPKRFTKSKPTRRRVRTLDPPPPRLDPRLQQNYAFVVLIDAN